MKEFNIEERVEKAKRLFKEGGYNCCQAVVLAYSDLFGQDLYAEIDLVTCVEKRISQGGTSQASVLSQIAYVKEELSK